MNKENPIKRFDGQEWYYCNFKHSDKNYRADLCRNGFGVFQCDIYEFAEEDKKIDYLNPVYTKRNACFSKEALTNYINEFKNITL